MMPSRAALPSILLLLVIGCGGPTLVPVSGRITLDDEPLAGAYVTFEPLKSHIELVSTGVTDDAGTYTLSCGDEPGAVAGTHRVLITTISPDDYQDELSTLPRDRVPPRYQDGSLTFDVPEGGTDSADVPLVTGR